MSFSTLSCLGCTSTPSAQRPDAARPGGQSSRASSMASVSIASDRSQSRTFPKLLSSEFIVTKTILLTFQNPKTGQLQTKFWNLVVRPAKLEHPPFSNRCLSHEKVSMTQSSSSILRSLNLSLTLDGEF